LARRFEMAWHGLDNDTFAMFELLMMPVIHRRSDVGARLDDRDRNRETHANHTVKRKK
jgi:hypothetical protein